jgi:hypothetical protein
MRSWGERYILLPTKSPTVADHTAPAIGASVLILFFSAYSGSATLPRMSRSANIVGPVTYGRLRADKRLVEVHCGDCSHISRLDPQALLFGDDVPVPGSHARFRCSKCGAVASYVRPDAVVPGCDGTYPKF